jgi:hypothetical protein
MQPLWVRLPAAQCQGRVRPHAEDPCEGQIDGEWVLSDPAAAHHLAAPDGLNATVLVAETDRKAHLEAACQVGGRSAEDARAMVAATDHDQGICACHFEANHVHIDGNPGPKGTPMFNVKALSRTALALPCRLQPPPPPPLPPLRVPGSHHLFGRLQLPRCDTGEVPRSGSRLSCVLRRTTSSLPLKPRIDWRL